MKLIFSFYLVYENNVCRKLNRYSTHFLLFNMLCIVTYFVVLQYPNLYFVYASNFFICVSDQSYFKNTFFFLIHITKSILLSFQLSLKLETVFALIFESLHKLIRLFLLLIIIIIYRATKFF